jgi:hypothetical protein
MEIRVIKTIIVFFFLNTQLLSSQRVAPVFIGPDSNAASNSNSRLFLYNVTDIDNKLMRRIYTQNGSCYSGTGLFRFVVHQNTDVEVISFTGKLPDALVEILKKRIEATSGMWTNEKRNGITTHSYPILLFVTFYIGFHDCEDPNNDVPIIGNMLGEAFMVTKDNGSQLIELPKGYLMPVLRFAAME